MHLFHDWYTFRAYTVESIQAMVNDSNYDPDLSDCRGVVRSNLREEKVCLECGEYVNEIADEVKKYRLKQDAKELKREGKLNRAVHLLSRNLKDK